ncbi:MAG TPA: UbiA-like polyprenyltransferase [Terriglobales bacterium]|nr:UbiA-like polyprenyltransferase [Terriglobales bacterium]
MRETVANRGQILISNCGGENRLPGHLLYNLMVRVFHNLRVTLEMIKWEHSIFVLPFALCGAMLAAHGLPNGHVLVWIVVAMVAARSAAMAFNRLADASIDAANPRTRARALPSGTLTPAFVARFVVVSSAIFVFAAWQLNRLAFLLSPLALAILLLYSFSKRFTRWSHLVLGFAMGIAPSAAWIAVRGSLDPRILLLTAAVTFWGGGFDVLYACQDYEFDRQTGLHSLPRYCGIGRSLWIARGFHLAMLLLLVSLIVVFGLGKMAVAGVAAVALLLGYEHSLVSPGDLSKLNAAFFTMNGVISVVFLLFIAGDLLVRR